VLWAKQRLPREDPGTGAPGEALGTSEAKQLVEYAIEQGRGGLYLHLTPDQYCKLRS
jgi:hypothetical protein